MIKVKKKCSYRNEIETRKYPKSKEKIKLKLEIKQKQVKAKLPAKNFDI